MVSILLGVGVRSPDSEESTRSSGSALFFGGVVEAGRVLDISGKSQSFGAKDLLCAKPNPQTRVTVFVRQIGSAGDDILAMRGGLALDANGSIVLVGHTYGSLYRTREESEGNDLADVFVIIL